MPKISLHALPSKLIYLKTSYRTSLKANLPSSLEFLHLSKLKSKDLDYLSLSLSSNSSLKEFHLDYCVMKLPSLPPQLTHLTLGQNNHPLPPLPSSLTHLHLGFNYTHTLPSLPLSLKEFTMTNRDLDITISYLSSISPNISVHVYFKDKFNQPIDKLPNNVKKITIGFSHLCIFNQPINSLPPNLTHLAISGCFSNSIDNLPPNLQHLDMTGAHNFNLPVNSLPPQLKFFFNWKS